MTEDECADLNVETADTDGTSSGSYWSPLIMNLFFFPLHRWEGNQTRPPITAATLWQPCELRRSSLYVNLDLRTTLFVGTKVCTLNVRIELPVHDQNLSRSLWCSDYTTRWLVSCLITDSCPFAILIHILSTRKLQQLTREMTQNDTWLDQSWLSVTQRPPLLRYLAGCCSDVELLQLSFTSLCSHISVSHIVSCTIFFYGSYRCCLTGRWYLVWTCLSMWSLHVLPVLVWVFSPGTSFHSPNKCLPG